MRNVLSMFVVALACARAQEAPLQYAGVPSGPADPSLQPGGLVYGPILLGPAPLALDPGLYGPRYFLGGDGLPQPQPEQPAPPTTRTGPITFGPEHARPAIPPPNPFRQGQAAIALQQQRQQQLLQQQQQAFAVPSSPSGKYVSLQPIEQQQPTYYGQ